MSTTTIQKSGTICTRNSGMIHVPNVKHECFKNCLNGIPGLRARPDNGANEKAAASCFTLKQGGGSNGSAGN